MAVSRKPSTVALPLPLLLLVVIVFTATTTPTADAFRDRLQVDMNFRVLNLVQGSEGGATCRINRTPGELGGSTVEFIFYPYDPTYSGRFPPVLLAVNGSLADGVDPTFYGVRVTVGAGGVSHTLVFKNPRPRDHGELVCRLTPDDGVTSPYVRRISSSRFVLVFGPRA